ncbi:MAG: serine/threonine-protein kinase [Deltaproteobacteria bacterium]
MHPHVPKPAASLVPGARVGRYMLIEPIAAGGFGSVWRATDESAEQVVALKIPHADLDRHMPPGSPSASDRFLKEARLLQGCDHPGVVRVYDVIDERPEGPIAYAMELISGQDLSDLVDTIALPVILEILARACEALAYVHERGVIHRDIKLSNIFVCDPPEHDDQDRVVKLIDFGIAKDIEDFSMAARTATGVFVGTLFTTAPECYHRLSGEPVTLTGAVDQWGIGIALYNAFTGQFPFQAGAPQHVVGQIMTQEVPAIVPLERFELDVCPPRLETVIRRCLEKDPARRYSSPAVVAAALRVVSSELIDASSGMRLVHLIQALPTSVGQRPAAWDSSSDISAPTVQGHIELEATQPPDPQAATPTDTSPTPATPPTGHVPVPVVLAIVAVGAIVAFLLGRLVS